jgi:hypothetical protein
VDDMGKAYSTNGEKKKASRILIAKLKKGH